MYRSYPAQHTWESVKMCAILGILDIKTDAAELRRKALNLSKLQRHRGPDWTGVYSNDKCILVHERLSIVDPMHGAQPLYNPEHTNILAVNGEIYNHQDLKKTLTCDFTFQTGSDCEIILAKYKEKGIDFLNELNGIFAFILYDAEKDEYLIARDHIGIIPLYTGYDKDGNFYVSSEMKSLMPVCTEVAEFPAGSYLWSRDGQIKKYYNRPWESYDAVKDNTSDVAKLRSALEDAVKRQLMSDVPYGVLLSGGLDSSVISAVAKKFADRRIEEGGKTGAWWPQLHSFAIGLKGAPDLEKAKEVADYIGTVHHEINFTVQEGIDALRDVIYHIETYDVIGTCHQVDGYQDGALGRRCRRDFRRLPLLPQGSERKGVPRGDRPQALAAPPLRLPARQQVDDGLGRRAARSVP